MMADYIVDSAQMAVVKSAVAVELRLLLPLSLFSYCSPTEIISTAASGECQDEMMPFIPRLPVQQASLEVIIKTWKVNIMIQ